MYDIFQECVKTLNTLQSNAQTLEKTRLTRDKLAPLHVPNMIKWASRVGITVCRFINHGILMTVIVKTKISNKEVHF